MDSMHIWGQKEAICNTLFGIFERWRGPQTSRGPENFPSFPPSRRACGIDHHYDGSGYDSGAGLLQLANANLV